MKNFSPYSPINPNRTHFDINNGFLERFQAQIAKNNNVQPRLQN